MNEIQREHVRAIFRLWQGRDGRRERKTIVHCIALLGVQETEKLRLEKYGAISAAEGGRAR